MAVNFRNELLKASKIHFEAHIEKHRINVENLLQNSVGVGEHPGVVEECEKLVKQIAEARELRETAKSYTFDYLDKE